MPNADDAPVMIERVTAVDRGQAARDWLRRVGTWCPALDDDPRDGARKTWAYWGRQEQETVAQVLAFQSVPEQVEFLACDAALAGDARVSQPLWQFVWRDLATRSAATMGLLMTDPELDALPPQLAWASVTQIQWWYVDPYAADVGTQVSNSPSAASGDAKRLSSRMVRCRDAERVLAVFRATQVESLDCPEISDWRTPSDWVRDHLATTRRAITQIYLLQFGAEDIGMMALSRPHVPTDAWTLDYLGVVPHYRGQGWGAHLARTARSWVGARGVSLMAAADVRNEPAMAIYRDSGFGELVRRQLWKHPLNRD